MGARFIDVGGNPGGDCVFESLDVGDHADYAASDRRESSTSMTDSSGPSTNVPNPLSIERAPSSRFLPAETKSARPRARANAAMNVSPLDIFEACRERPVLASKTSKSNAAAAPLLEFRQVLLRHTLVMPSQAAQHSIK